MTEPFKNRIEGARALVPLLEKFAHPERSLVLALPRGGVPVGHEIASRLGLPFDVLLVRKLGVPGHEELAFGAIAANGAMVLNESIVKSLRITEEAIASVSARERKELERRENAFRPGGKPYDFSGKTLIIADDGLATGATMRAAVEAAKGLGAREIIVAAPVGSIEACERMKTEYQIECVCAERPTPFLGVGRWYFEFPQLSDGDVRRYLELTGGTETVLANG